jgi:hypothetical protein
MKNLLESVLIKILGTANTFYSITPSDVTEYTNIRSIRVGSGGNIAFVNSQDETVSFVNCYDGEEIPIKPKQILATGTTASNIVAYV